MYTGERQVSTLRKKYLEAVLKQDVGFFDTDARTGDVVFSVSTDTLLVQDAISEKVQFFFLFPFTFPKEMTKSNSIECGIKMGYLILQNAHLGSCHFIN